MKVKVKLLSHVRLSATPWTVAHQAPPSMGFSRQALEWVAISLVSYYPYTCPFPQSNTIQFFGPMVISGLPCYVWHF